MTFPIKKIAAVVAWGLALGLASEMVLAGVYGGWFGAQLGRGRSGDEISASPANKAWRKWHRGALPGGAAIGLALGLLELLPGTKGLRKNR